MEKTYIKVMGLDGDALKDRENCPSWHALQRAHEIRQFEIELYWKRGTYFFALQVAVFAAVGFSMGRNAASIGAPFLELLLACLGFLSARAGWLAAQGSKFWVENWERHIDELEDQFEGKLHKTVWSVAGTQNWSVTGVNNRLLQAFTGFWVGICGHALFAIGSNYGWPIPNLCNPAFGTTMAWLSSLAILVTTVRIAILMFGETTRLLQPPPSHRLNINGKQMELRIRERSSTILP